MNPPQMTPQTLESYLLVGAMLFVLGMIGFVARRNLILMFLSAETMLQGVAIFAGAAIVCTSIFLGVVSAKGDTARTVADYKKDAARARA